MKDNEDVAEVYMMTRGQYITAGDGNMPVDISIPAIKVAMDVLNVKDPRGCLVRTRELWHHFIGKHRGEE